MAFLGSLDTKHLSGLRTDHYFGYWPWPTLSVTHWILNYFQFLGQYAIELKDIEAHVSELERPAQEADGERGR